MSLRSRLLAVSVALIVLAMAAADLWLVRDLQVSLIAHITEETKTRLRLCADLVARNGLPTDPLDVDRLADQLGQSSELRVTFVAQDGTVLGDSEVAPQQLAHLENHASRPEIAQARSHGTGTAIRQSPTIGVAMLYAAQWVVPQHGPPLTVRVARHFGQVTQEIEQVRQRVVLASALGLAVALLMATLAARWMVRDVRQLTQLAQRMAAGDLLQRSDARAGGEMATMGRAMDRLAADLTSALRSLQQERDKLARVFAGLAQGVLLVDGDNRIALANRALMQLLDLPPDPKGLPLLDALRHAELKHLLDLARLASEPVQAELRWEGQTALQLLVRATKLGEAGAEVVAVFVDLTALRHLETLRKDFVANAAHELRTPIAALRGGAETAARLLPDRPADATPFVHMILRNAERLQFLVDDLLDLSRLEASARRLEAMPLWLGPCIAAIVQSRAVEAQQVAVSVEVALPGDLPPVLADAAAVEQILGNLLDNAFRYAALGGSVQVSAVVQDRHVRISVRDHGPGIVPEHVARLFERFYRVDTGRSRAAGGTGLGLAIAKHLAEGMGGHIGVVSNVGQGSTFWLQLPSAS